MAPIGKFSGVTKTGFSRVDNILATNIAGIDNTSLALDPGVTVLRRYTFENEPTNSSTGEANGWVPTVESPLGLPTFDYAWYNALINGGNDNYTTDYAFGGAVGTKKFIKWNCNSGQTPSSYTGPNTGGASNILLPTQGDDQQTLAQQANSKYLYAETSNSGVTDKAFFCYLLFGNITSQMSNTNNDLKLEFYVHAASSTATANGNRIGNLYLRGRSMDQLDYVGFGGSPTNSTTFNIAGFSGTFLNDLFPNTSASGDGTDPWYRITLDINDFKEAELADSTVFLHTIYFIYTYANFYYGDLCIDNVSLLEVPV
jgi:hypothetical protein